MMKIRMKVNIDQTFQNRGAPFSVSIQSNSDELRNIQPLWAGHLRALGNPRSQAFDLPRDNVSAFDELNQSLSALDGF